MGRRRRCRRGRKESKWGEVAGDVMGFGGYFLFFCSSNWESR